MQEDAIEFCQIDSCRIAGPSEIFSVLLMAAKNDIKVCPHAGGVGLCEYVRHLSMIDYCCFASSLEGRICESTTHLHQFFEDADPMFRKDDVSAHFPRSLVCVVVL